MNESRFHVAIIMDGNGRWAQRRGLPRIAGHRAGAHAVRRAITAAPKLGIGTLTLYAFSSDNWQRPPSEVQALMQLFRRYLRWEAARCIKEGVRVSAIGRRDRLPEPLLRELERTEALTRDGRELHLRLAVDYSGRDAIVSAAAEVGADVTREEFARALARAVHAEHVPDVDLLIRTAGEQRLSDFLLWECAYAEFVFTPRMWPEFGELDLAAAMQEFRRRERRFGRVEPLPAVHPTITAEIVTGAD